jgi:hypothetical protein
LLIGFLLPSLSLFGQTSFEEYFAVAKQGKVTEREARLASQCGVKREEAKIVYGFTSDENWTWHKKKSLGHGLEDAEMDYYGSAAMWVVNGKPRFIDVWMLITDEGDTYNEMFCLDEDGHVKLQESLTRQDPTEDENKESIYLQRKSFQPTGQSNVQWAHFVDESGHAVAPPKLDMGEMVDAKATLGSSLAQELIRKLFR